MKRLYIGIALFGTLLLAGAWIVLARTESQSEPTTNVIATAEPAAQAPVKSSPQPIAKGQYIAYSSDVIASTPGTKLLFFHASWCRQCQQIDASIRAQGVPDGVSIIKIDYDNSPELRKKYGITLQTTFVKVNDQGDLLQKFVAYREPTFDSVRRELL